jgi:1-acyl-sn-glycerol-3-phosphate acyltransferase
MAAGLLKPSMEVIREENIPKSGPCLVTMNHYARPGFHAWWLALAISSVIPMEVHWVVTSSWNFSDTWRRRTITPATRWLFSRIAEVYRFTTMPPMPPSARDVEIRAVAVRRVLSFARKTTNPVIGFSPEGRDIGGGKLGAPPPGVGRFILHLSEIGLTISPVGVFEFQDHICLNFGPSYCLKIDENIEPGAPDTVVSSIVMDRISECLPILLR